LLYCLSQGRPDKYQLQAAISALHSEAENWSQTDWQQIRLLYLELYKKLPTPVVQLNALVALAHSGNIKKAFSGLEELSSDLVDYTPFHAARADILSKLGKNKMAISSYQKAIDMTHNQAERNFLTKQRAKLIPN